MNLEQKKKEVEFGRLQYSSSWDRGLDNLLYILPWIKERCPEISLHVYYGISGWIKAAKSRNDTSALKLIDSLYATIEELDYVHIHDRINQLELSKEWRKAWLWLYPTNFTETFCITAKEAQFSYTPIICSDVAALQTTVGENGRIISGHPYSKESREEYIRLTIELYHDQQKWEEQAILANKGSVGASWSSRWDNYWSLWL